MDRYTAIKCKDFEEFNYMNNYFVKMGYKWSGNVSKEINDKELSYYFKDKENCYLLVDPQLKKLDAIYSIKGEISLYDKEIDAKIFKRKEKFKKLYEGI